MIVDKGSARIEVMKAAVPLVLAVLFAALCLTAIAASPALAQTTMTPATLTGEVLVAADAEFELCRPIDFANPGAGEFCYSETSVEADVDCDAGTASFTIEGAAGGPYPGTFTEQGTITFEYVDGTVPSQVGITGLEAEFRIDSTAGVVTGTKTYDLPGTIYGGFCISENLFGLEAAGLTYEAQIETPMGQYRDEGHSSIQISGGTVESFQERFFSLLREPVPLMPTTREACKDGGYKLFPAFKNQGDCVSFVATGGKSEPGRNQPGTSP